MRAARIIIIGLLAGCGLANGQTNFCVQNIGANADGSITIVWPVTPTWTYHVMYANALDESWQDFPDGELTDRHERDNALLH